MSEASGAAGAVKTLGVQLSEDRHSQFSLLAGLEGLSLKDAVLAAVDLYIATRKEALAEKANQALAEVEREAALKRDALTALFGSPSESSAEAAKPTKPAGKRMDA